MSHLHLKRRGVLLATVLAVSACSTADIKQENTDLKQQVKQETQTRQEYADKLRSVTAMSEKERSRAQEEVKAMRRDLNKALEENQLIVKKVDNLTVIEMQYSALFGSGQAELSKEGKAIIKNMATAFKKYPNYHMRVEGYTDNVPIHQKLKQRYYSNWELSAARAATVVRYMIFALNVPSKNLSIAGYADNRPVVSNDTEQGRAQNRRIRAVVFKS